MSAALVRIVDLAIVDTLDCDTIEQAVGGRVAKRTVVLEQDQSSRRHLAARRRSVVIKHLLQSRPQQFQILPGEAGAFFSIASEAGRYVAMSAVETIGHDMLAPMVRIAPLDSASASVVAAIRVMVTSSGKIGSIERARRTAPVRAPGRN